MSKILFIYFLALHMGCIKMLGANPVIVSQFDWDDNVVIMPTQGYLIHKVSRHEIAFPTGAFVELLHQVGKPGPYEFYHFDECPKTGTFRNLRDHDNRNIFLEDITKMVETSAPEDWQGQMWKPFVQALNHPRLYQYTGIITSRGHSPETLLSGLTLLQSKGFFKNLPLKQNLFGVRHPQFAHWPFDVSERKTLVMIDSLDALEKTPVSESMDPLVHWDGESQQRFHVWAFSDDDPNNILKAISILSPEYAKGRWPHIKIMITYTGEGIQDLKQGAYTFRSDGSMRPMGYLEIHEIYEIYKKDHCENQLQGQP